MIDDGLNAVQRFLRRLGLAVGDDVRAIGDMLLPGETMVRLVRGRDDDHRLVWAATPRRLYLVQRDGFVRTVHRLRWSAVNDIAVRTEPHGVVLTLETVRGRYVLYGSGHATASAFAAYVRERRVEAGMRLPVSVPALEWAPAAASGYAEAESQERELATR